MPRFTHPMGTFTSCTRHVSSFPHSSATCRPPKSYRPVSYPPFIDSSSKAHLSSLSSACVLILGFSIFFFVRFNMTVKPVKEMQDRGLDVSDLQKPNDFLSPGNSFNFGDLAGEVAEAKPLKVCTEPDADRESGVSSEDMESPRSVVEWRRKKSVERVHSQVLRIREEDSHLGEDIAEVFSGKDKVIFVGGVCGGGDHRRQVTESVDVVFFSRPILPCSPLSGKTTTVKALH